MAFATFSADAQQSVGPADGALSFTVASVKPLVLSQAQGRSGGRPLDEPGRLRFSAVTLKGLLINAYDVKDFQIVGPAWLGDQMFTIEATMPTDTTKDQTGAMLRNLLAERFKMQVHRESKSLATYSLGVAKNGLKIPNTSPTHPTQLPDSGLASDGFPFVPPEITGVTTWVMNGKVKVAAQQATMGELAVQLQRLLDRPVTDDTRLTAKFDFSLTFSPEGLIGPGGRPIPTPPQDATAAVDAREPLKDIFAALRSELGVKLEQKKAPVEMIVIDHIDKVPTGN